MIFFYYQVVTYSSLAIEENLKSLVESFISVTSTLCVTPWFLGNDPLAALPLLSGLCVTLYKRINQVPNLT